MGDVALLAAEIVGPSGSVTGIDREGVVLEKAKQRAIAQGHSPAVQFLHSDLLSFQIDTQYDAVIGRYFLLYQPDPSKALTHAIALVRPGGIVCFHEMSFGSPARSFPETSLFGNMLTLIGDVFRRVGINPDMGLLLAKTFATQVSQTHHQSRRSDRRRSGVVPLSMGSRDREIAAPHHRKARPEHRPGHPD